MKTKGILLIILGILGAIFVCSFDVIIGKTVNDIICPKSTPALIICGVLIIAGIRLFLRAKGACKK